MEDRVFSLGRQNPQEGGPKGLDIDAGMNVLVATSEHQPLVMFDLAAILQRVPAAPPVQDAEYEFGVLAHADRLRTKLAQAEGRAAKAEAKAAKAKARLAAARSGWPSRIARRLSRLYSALRREN